jgi:hypothetical protein
MKFSHSKYKNTGILFELLIRKVTSDTLSGKDSPSVNIIKKYFTNTELGKEYKLYDAVFKSNTVNETKANNIVNTILELSKKLNRTSLKKEKYNLIKEIKENYNLDDFFKTKINNYKPLAALSILIELYSANEIFNPDLIIENKTTLLEHLTNNNLDKINVKEGVIDEFKKYDKDLRMLTYRVLLEKFNTKYSDLYPSQKTILKEFINSVDSSSKLKEFYNSKIQEIKKEISNSLKSITDKATKIKLFEINNLIKEIDKNKNITEHNLIDLLQYYELIEELKTIK